MRHLVFIAMFLLFVSTLASAKDSIMIENLHRMRVKQQDEEMVIRAQIFKNVQTQEQCTPVQQVRQRIRDVGTKSGDESDGQITVNAGHDQLNVTDNHGTINSDVNVNIIKQGRNRDCL